eukprot:365861-Chlamydomonas_euryale.AAC.19
MCLKACGLALPSFIVSSQNAAVSKTQLLSHECSAIGTGLPLRMFELQQQPLCLLNATPGVGKGAERVLKLLGGCSASQEVGRPPFSVDHRNYTTVIYSLWRKIGVITYALVPKTVLTTLGREWVWPREGREWVWPREGREWVWPREGRGFQAYFMGARPSDHIVWAAGSGRHWPRIERGVGHPHHPIRGQSMLQNAVKFIPTQIAPLPDWPQTKPEPLPGWLLTLRNPSRA